MSLGRERRRWRMRRGEEDMENEEKMVNEERRRRMRRGKGDGE